MKQEKLNKLITATVSDLFFKGGINQKQYNAYLHSKPLHLRLCNCEECKVDRNW